MDQVIQAIVDLITDLGLIGLLPIGIVFAAAAYIFSRLTKQR